MEPNAKLRLAILTILCMPATAGYAVEAAISGSNSTSEGLSKIVVTAQRVPSARLREIGEFY